MFHASRMFPNRFKQRIRLYAVVSVASHYIGTTTKETLVGEYSAVVQQLSTKVLVEENLNQSLTYYSVFMDKEASVQPSSLVEINGVRYKLDIPPKKQEGMTVLRVVST